MSKDNRSLQLSPQANELAEKVSLHYENVYNLPRIGCRILALLLVLPDPISMLDMETYLKVSHASISTNLRLLVALGYVEKVLLSGDRTTYFRFLPRSRVRALQERIVHYQELKEVIAKARKEIPFDGDVPDHLQEMLDWADLAIKMNAEFIREWQLYIRSLK